MLLFNPLCSQKFHCPDDQSPDLASYPLSYQRTSPSPRPETTLDSSLRLSMRTLKTLFLLLPFCLIGLNLTHLSRSQNSRILVVSSWIPYPQHRSAHSVVGLFPDWQRAKGSIAGSHEATRQTGHFGKKGKKSKRGTVVYFSWKKCIRSKFPPFL